MGERKVLNRYVPPDFDPSLIPKFKRDRNRLIEVRMMLPFSLRCNTCGEYMYRGKKFNSKKEDVKDEDYMGIKKIRFYIKCSHCAAEIAFKTDPKNSDYECESGASRNFELWRDTTLEVDKETKEREEEEDMDAMKALEHRTIDNKIEMDVLDALDEIKALKYRHEKLDMNQVLLLIDKKHNVDDGSAPSSDRELPALTKEDEKSLASIKMRSQHSVSAPVSIGSFLFNGNSNVGITAGTDSSKNAINVIKKKRKVDTLSVAVPGIQSDEPEQLQKERKKSEVLSSLLNNYGEDDD